MVLTNISSALILEDDADWNVRLRSQVQDFALSTLALTHPLLPSKSRYADPTHPVPQSSAVTPVTEMSIKSLPSTVPPTISPYGDNWDLLWLGHCGMHFPSTLRPFPEKIPKGLVVHQPDSAESDNSDHGNAYQEKAFSINIRWSARLNVEALLTGSTDFDDQFPDTQCD
jgi:hypothetical protein